VVGEAFQAGNAEVTMWNKAFDPGVQQMTITSPSQLADMLRAAANAHDVHEQSLGHSDSDWPTWYARYIFDNQTKAQDAMLGDYGA
jgi:hypothetical protein